MEKYVYPNLKRGEKKIVKRLMSMPVRDISRSKKTMDYIKKNGVYASMTSSPERLRQAAAVLYIVLQSPYIRRFYINLPHRYRNKKAYKKRDVEYLKKVDPRVTIRWIKKDIGPISKILPSLERARNKKAIIISFDDDVCYPPALVNELIYYSVRYPDIIPGGAGFSFGDMEDFIKRDAWPQHRRPRFPRVDVIEGWGAVAYRKEMVDIPFVKELNKIGTVCKLSDDLTLSYSFANWDVPRKIIFSEYFSGNEDVHPFKYGEGAGALHKGSGTSYTDVADANMVKYKECLELIDEHYE